MCCDFGGQSHNSDVVQCPTAIFNICQSCDVSDFVPETLDWCKSHYVPPVQKYITCTDFGHTDAMNGSCWWCMEMTPYQWYMCQDESWVRSLLGDLSKLKNKNRAEAISFVDGYKQQNPMAAVKRRTKTRLYNCPEE